MNNKFFDMVGDRGMWAGKAHNAFAVLNYNKALGWQEITRFSTKSEAQAYVRSLVKSSFQAKYYKIKEIIL
jgi:hypothetical protein